MNDGKGHREVCPSSRQWARATSVTLGQGLTGGMDAENRSELGMTDRMFSTFFPNFRKSLVGKCFFNIKIEGQG